VQKKGANVLKCFIFEICNIVQSVELIENEIKNVEHKNERHISYFVVCLKREPLKRYNNVCFNLQKCIFENFKGSKQ